MLQEMQQNLSQITASFIDLQDRLLAILQASSRAEKSEKTDIFQIILDVLKVAGHGTQYLNSLRRRFLVSKVSNEYKDLPRYAADLESWLFVEELKDSLKKTKSRHYHFHSLKPKHKDVPSQSSSKSKLSDFVKIDRIFKHHKVDFTIKSMVSHHLLVVRFRAEIPFFKAVNISNHIQNWKNITNKKFILNIIKNGVSGKF